MRDLGAEYQLAAVTVVTSFETMGLLIFKRVAPMDLVLDPAGGIVYVMCNKPRKWQQDLREEQQQPSWVEWLGDQVMEMKVKVEPAYIRHQ